MRWSVSRLLYITLIACLVFGAAVAFRGDAYFFFQTANLVMLTFTSLGAYYSSPHWRRAWLGFAIFGWTYLVIVLRLLDGNADTVVIGWIAGGISSLMAMLLPTKGR
jgi:hypothetical protein